MADKLPGKGFFGWFGRQIGYVTKAVSADPVAKSPAKRLAPQSKTPRPATSPKPSAAPAAAPAADAGVLYRKGEVQEAEHPTQPGVKLRRTIIDEVIVERDKPGEQ